MKTGLVVAPLLIAATAHAQAPGDYEGSAEVAPPGMAPVVAPVVAAPVEKPRRWSVGLGIGSINVAPHSAPDAESEFAVGQLAVRFRATRRLEIELAFAGGREQVEDYEGDREVSTAVVGLRYRFMPERRWNWWLMAGMGAFSVTHHEASDEVRDAATQSTLQFGVGLERRWRRFALQAELRAVGVKPNDEDEVAPAMPVRPNGQPLPPYEPVMTQDGWAGGQFTISGNFYF